MAIYHTIHISKPSLPQLYSALCKHELSFMVECQNTYITNLETDFYKNLINHFEWNT